jgi:hypothetical protein
MWLSFEMKRPGTSARSMVQYSLGNSSVVTLRSASVMTHTFVSGATTYDENTRPPFSIAHVRSPVLFTELAEVACLMTLNQAVLRHLRIDQRQQSTGRSNDEARVEQSALLTHTDLLCPS